MTEIDYTIVFRAVSFAARHHEGQLRKDGRTPYVAHPARVLAILTSVFGVKDPEVLAAGVLHDTIEDTLADCDDLIEEFGERVAGFVALLTKDKRLPEEERERTYFEALAAAPLEVKLCKLADTYDNLDDSSDLSVEFRTKKSHKARELLNAFASGFPGEWSHALEHVRQQIETTDQMIQRGD
ncbi:MAG: bifunctional (p)ppGpp synthetase/guanosine-3',5'-bis(diphosphate) 3'-pyrophosphohydrolase [Planctomycetes bacterium]|nr:bifunctional (p)ppGpp synthetase/guanosine-3',5'-bis(diphosphate) 3'-pyrophosphohydrolase [Planctomycetota bacterium]